MNDSLERQLRTTRIRAIDRMFPSQGHRIYDVFLYNSQAVRCSLELYAAWFATWVKRGGQVVHHRDYEFRSLENWAMPTRSTNSIIPDGYGDDVLHFVVFTNLASIPGDPDAAKQGEGKVLRLSTSLLGSSAHSTHRYSVESFSDVDEYLRTTDPRSLVRLARESVKRARLQ